MKGYGSLLAATAIVALLAASALVAAPAVSDRTPFFTRGEPREALVVQTIARGEGLVLPMRNGNELPSKPPLFHWLGALASRVHGGVTEGPIRFPGFVLSLVTVAATAAAAWSWWGRTTGVLTAFVLATSFQWLASSVTARVDMVLAACIALALLLFAKAVEMGRRVPRAAYALMAAATLTKGPVGLVLPVGVAVATLAARRELAFLGSRDLRLLAIAAGAAGLWYALAVVFGGEAFVAKQILKENVYRVLDPDSVEAGHVAPFWYYGPLLAAGMAPWSLFAPGLVLAALAWRRAAGVAAGPAGAAAAVASAAPADGGMPLPADPDATVRGDVPDHAGAFASRPAPGDTLATLPAAEPVRPGPHDVFAIAWAVLPFVLFSAAGSKRAVYLLPAYPAYAMLLARGFTLVISRGAPGGAGLALGAGAALLAALLAVVVVVMLAGAAGIPVASWLEGLVSDADVNNVAPMMAAMHEHVGVVLPVALVLGGSAWVLAVATRRGGWARAFAATAAAMLALSAAVSTTLLPSVAARRSARAFMAQVEAHVPADVPLSFYRAFDYGAVFYRGAAIAPRSSLQDVPGPDGAWLLTWPAFLPDLVEEARGFPAGGASTGGYEVQSVLAPAEVDPSDRTTLVLVRLVRRIGDERSDGK